jgi:hypothetical protein
MIDRILGRWTRGPVNPADVRRDSAAAGSDLPHLTDEQLLGHVEGAGRTLDAAGATLANAQRTLDSARRTLDSVRRDTRTGTPSATWNRDTPSGEWNRTS